MASSRREKELARQRAARQAARRAEALARRKRRNAVVASAVAVVLVVVAAVWIGLASRSDDPAAAAGAAPAPSAAPGTCAYPPGRPASKPAPVPSTQDVERQQPFTATLTTSQGTVVLALDSAAAPCTVNSFRSLAGAQFFDDTPCHRLTASPQLKVVQCGDPSGTGSGSPGYEFADENLAGATYPRGTVAMANSGPGTNGSQFFLVYADSQLPPSYTPFGTVTAGLDVLEKVAAGGSTPPGDGKPVLPLQITGVQVAPA
ncbi:MAG: putative peptidyl-prolyl cis-trans isomerase cyclophilin type [Frankiales bacterium]|nr:putative peptidyl-prolyl cis-trans isomerase cyclophilin type [Frankiales bacterium]